MFVIETLFYWAFCRLVQSVTQRYSKQAVSILPILPTRILELKDYTICADCRQLMWAPYRKCTFYWFSIQNSEVCSHHVECAIQHAVNPTQSGFACVYQNSFPAVFSGHTLDSWFLHSICQLPGHSHTLTPQPRCLNIPCARNDHNFTYSITSDDSY